MAVVAWEKPIENWLLGNRTWLVAGLVVTAAISAYFAVELARGKAAIPAAAWLAYVVAP